MSPHDRTPFTRQDTTAHTNSDRLDREKLLAPHQSGSARSSVSGYELRRIPSNLSNITGDDGAPVLLDDEPPKADEKPVSWMSLPHKDQLLILLIIRFAEPITQTSITAYMFYMLKSFDNTKSDADISYEAGLLSAGFTAAQCCTAVMYGRLADGWLGRKNVLLIGLIGVFISTIGFGFSTSFGMSLFFRCLGGALNGDVAVMRTMISETVKEKKYQPKAFLIMPITFNVGVLIGPILGGWLESPAVRFPKAFGQVEWLAKYPYALPNIVTASFLLFSFALAFLGLKETHIDHQHRKDYGLIAGRWLVRKAQFLIPSHRRRRQHSRDYTQLEQTASDTPEDLELATPLVKSQHPISSGTRPKLPLRRIFTRNVLFTFLGHGLLAVNLGAFNNLWFIYLSTPRFDPRHPQPPTHTVQKLPFSFTGGLGLPPPTIGFAVGIIGVIGLLLQFGVYSRVTHRLGLIPSYRYNVVVFPLVATLIPFLSIIPTPSTPPAPANGAWLWTAISSLLFIQTLGRTFCLPITQILVNNCTPHPSVLGTVHGMAQMVSSFARTVGPIVWTFLYGVGLKKGIVGIAWWALALEGTLILVCSFFVYEGNGHEIWLEGDE